MASRQRFTGQEYRQKEDAAGRPLFARDGTPILEPATPVEPVPETKPQRSRSLLIVALGMTAFVGLILVALATLDAPGSSADRYTQTWTTPYSATTCGDWSGRMTADQRQAGSAAILRQLRQESGTVPAASYAPSDGLIRTFQTGVTSACALSSTGPLLSAASLVFALDPAYAS